MKRWPFSLGAGLLGLIAVVGALTGCGLAGGRSGSRDAAAAEKPADQALRYSSILKANPRLSGYVDLGPDTQTGLRIYGRDDAPNLQLLVDGNGTVRGVRAIYAPAGGMQPWFDPYGTGSAGPGPGAQTTPGNVSGTYDPAQGGPTTVVPVSPETIADDSSLRSSVGGSIQPGVPQGYFTQTVLFGKTP